MRILLFSHPRSASTYLQEILAHIYRIGLTGEPFNEVIDNPKQYIIDHDNFVTKICTPVFNNNYKYEDFDFTIFDQVVVSDRRNFAASCASVYYAQSTGIYQRNNKEHLNNLKPFSVPVSFMRGFINEYQVFLDIVQKLKDNNIKYKMFYYEDILNDINLIINSFPNKFTSDLSAFEKTFVSTDIDYSKWCNNYDELENTFVKLSKQQNEIYTN